MQHAAHVVQEDQTPCTFTTKKLEMLKMRGSNNANKGEAPEKLLR